MPQEKNHGSENRNWMEIAETDAINDVRHSGQRLPFIAAAVSLLIIGGGAVFAQTNNEAPAQEEISVTQSPVVMSNPTTTVSKVAAPSVGGSVVAPAGVPMIPNVAPGAGNYEDDDDDEEDDDHDDDDDHEDDD